MRGDCFNCADPAGERHTVVLGSGKRLEGKALCEECAAAFRDVEWLDLVDPPPVARGDSAEREPWDVT